MPGTGDDSRQERICPFASDKLLKLDNCGHSIYLKCYKQKFSPTLRAAAYKLGSQVISSIVKDLVTGVADFPDLEEADIHPDIKHSISEYCEMMMSIKQRIGK